MTEKIESLQNPRVKLWIKLHKPRDRRKTGRILIEGLREISMALTHGIEIENLIISSTGLQLLNEPAIQKLIPTVECIEVSDVVFSKITYREQSDGLLVVARPLYLKLEDLKLSTNPILVILESVEKPGNLGAILRTADAANADAMIICDPATDIYNPNVIRSSLGCIFSMPLVACTSSEAFEWIKTHNIKSFAATLNASSWYHQADMTGPSAIVMGAEAGGLSDFWLKNAACRIKIPMLGKVDSLNVSTSTAIILFEALRQRGFGMAL
ncbi:MAG: RNA methyltransferase [Bacteroidales bacterium]|nr:RNA methyltransferase [Bacteroidales bacterium]